MHGAATPSAVEVSVSRFLALPWSTVRPYMPVIAVAAVFLTAGGLRLWEFTARGLWFDEAFTWRMVHYPFAEMMGRAARDNCPPLYYVVLHAWIGTFGDSVAALRSLSTLSGLLAVGGMYLFAREALESRGTKARGLALFVAALVATSAFQVRYSGEVRPYAFGAALAALSAWTLFRATRPGPASARRWAVHGLVTLLFAYTHYYAIFSIAAQALYLAGWLLAVNGWRIGATLRSLHFRYAAMAGAIVAVGWLPWLPIFLKQRAQVQAAFWSVPVTGWTLPHLGYQMFFDPLGPISYKALPYNRMAVVAGTLVVGIILFLRRARGADWHVLLAGVGPFAMSVLASMLDTQAVTLRYFVFAHLFLLAGVGVVVWQIRRPALRNAVAAAAVGASLLVTLKFLDDQHLDEHPGARAAAQCVAAHRRPGEPVVVASPFWYQPVAYHLGSPDVRLYDDGEPMPHYYGTAVIRPEELMNAAELAATGARRVWLVGGFGRYWGKAEVPAPDGWVLRDEQEFAEALRVGKVVVRLYERPAAGRDSY